ncbi:hypothetical protein AB0O34_20260 [Sphaerisporangium sp. NPDC088356]|uniref:hypothetical protein n=1 Tax=Sphaerisporangium sp. NPDC088356 TaxID=3154871 RepID=UPI00342F34F3
MPVTVPVAAVRLGTYGQVRVRPSVTHALTSDGPAKQVERPFADHMGTERDGQKRAITFSAISASALSHKEFIAPLEIFAFI